jgi:phosphoglycolate phosphatase-like HAD superfamily hydrolase
MLILFDVDGTLLRSKNAGLHAMQDAARKIVGEHATFEGIDTAGRLDQLIWGDLARRNGLADPDAHHDRFRALYAEFFEARLRDNPTAFALPGVQDLLEALDDVDDLVLGLLTGNYPETGRMKIEHAGIAPELFTVHAWGIDGGHRRDLPPIAIRRYEDRHGRGVESERVVIIGDTPHDVDCAHHNGCRCLAVATGRFTIDELEACGPELALPDLADTRRVRDWLVSMASGSIDPAPTSR